MLGCLFKLCPPANDRWHPWPFLHRLREGTLALVAAASIDTVVYLEPDNGAATTATIPPRGARRHT